MKHLWISLICLALLWTQVLAAPKRAKRAPKVAAAAAKEPQVLTEESIEAARTASLARNARKYASCLEEVRLLEIELDRQKTEPEVIWRRIEEKLNNQKRRCQEDKQKRIQRTAHQYQNKRAQLGLPVVEQPIAVEQETEESRQVKAEIKRVNAQISAIKLQIIDQNKLSREHLQAERERATREQQEMRAANFQLEREIAELERQKSQKARGRQTESHQLNQARQQVRQLEEQLRNKQTQETNKNAQEQALQAQIASLQREVSQLIATQEQNEERKQELTRQQSARQAEALEVQQLQRTKLQLQQQLQNHVDSLQAVVGSLSSIQNQITEVRVREDRQKNQHEAKVVAEREKIQRSKENIVTKRARLAQLERRAQLHQEEKQRMAADVLKSQQDLSECKAHTAASRQQTQEVIQQTSL